MKESKVKQKLSICYIYVYTDICLYICLYVYLFVGIIIDICVQVYQCHEVRGVLENYLTKLLSEMK